MKTWNDYKDYVKGINSAEKKNLEEVEELAKIIGTLILQRKAMGLSQRDLAKMCGMPQSSIGRIESHRMIPRLDTLLKLLHALGLDLVIRPSSSV